MAKTISGLRTWTAADIPTGCRVLVRVDANVTIKNGRADISASGRIARSIPEIKKLLKRHARIILMTHLGSDTESTAPIAKAFSQLLDRPVLLAKDVVGKDASQLSALLEPGSVMMLENLRSDRGEEENDVAFARHLALLGDVYVNNAFGVCHRKHASVVAMTKCLPSFAGELLVREVSELTQPIAKPFVLVVGGVKIDTKLPLLEKLGVHASCVVVGSALADELAHHPKLSKHVHSLLGDKLQLPIDLRRDADHHAFDVGAKTEKMFATWLEGAATILWNGPVGVVEHAAGRHGTTALANAIMASSARTIVGGGDTVAFLESMKITKQFSWVSTGGGAMLALLAGEKLPGLEVLR